MSQSLLPRKPVIAILSLTLLMVLCSCKEEVVPEIFNPREDHRTYSQGISKMGLEETALGQGWLSEAEKALSEPVMINAPFAEHFYLDPATPSGIGYRFSVKRGQIIEVDVDPEMKDSTIVFMDLFRLDTDDHLAFSHIASGDRSELILGFESRSDSDYVLRLQPELLRGGRYSVTIKIVPSLDFPVAGKGKSAILSFFGDPRDGGKRDHHGVDIFAKRHTPIVAPTDGKVRFSGERGLGGQVVWLRDQSEDQTLYFAHLEDIYVERGDLVSTGDTIGTVGNSGNARTTAPHLHFGIYSSGPVDPFHYIVETKTTPRKIWGDKEKLGQWVRTTSSARLSTDKASKKGKKVTLERHQMLRLMGVSSYSYRVLLPDGTTGYVQHTEVEDASRPVRIENIEEEITLLERPFEIAMNKQILKIGEQVRIHGSHKDYLFVSGEDGLTGWVMAP